jgi:hypothetical protein
MSKELVAEQPKSELAIVADKIREGLEAFEARKAELTTLKEEVEHLKIESIEDKAAIKQVTEARKKLKSARVEIEKEGKSMRDPLTAVNKNISAKEKELIDIIEPTEKALSKQELWVKQENERIEREAEERETARIQDRINRMSAYGYEIDYNMVKLLGDDDFEKMVERAKREFEKEEADKAERARKEQEQREQDERDRAELKALREKQEAADKILREREEEIARKEAEFKRQEEERAEAQRREREDKERTRIREIFANRLPQLKEWSSNGHYVYAKGGQWGTVTDIVDMNDIKFDQLVKENDAYISARDAEKERIRQQDIKEAAEKALAEQKERDAESARQEAERIAASSDKDKFAIIYSYLENMPLPEMKAIKSKKGIAAIEVKKGELMAYVKMFV